MDLAQFWFQGAGGPTPPFQLGNSLRFRGAQSLSRVPASNGNRQTFTHSFWLKKIGVVGAITSAGSGAIFSTQQQSTQERFRTSNSEETGFGQIWNAGGRYQGIQGRYTDPGGWYHVVAAFDSTQAAAADRLKIYINGELKTRTSNADITQNQNWTWNSTLRHNIGKLNTNDGTPTWDTNFLQGYLAEYHMVDGTALEPGTFGEFNADGVWVPREVEGVNYGTNGFYLDFSDPDDIGADRSGNGNNFTATGFELTDTTSTNYDWVADSPTRNSSLYNPLHRINDRAGDLRTANYQHKLHTDGTTKRNFPKYYQSIALPPSGKWYFECMNETGACGTFLSTTQWLEQLSLGVTNPAFENQTDAFTCYCTSGGGNFRYNGGQKDLGKAFTAGTWMGVAIDMDNQTYRHWDGTFSNTGSFAGYPTDQDSYFSGSNNSSTNASTFTINSGGSPYQFAVPDGYQPLSTAELPNVAITNPSEHFQTILGPGPTSTTPTALNYNEAGGEDTPRSVYDNEIYGFGATYESPDANHLMFQWAANLDLNGFTDWYIPAVYESMILYRNLKPTTDASVINAYDGSNPHAVPPVGSYTDDPPVQTTVAAFQQGGAEAWDTDRGFWTSTQSPFISATPSGAYQLRFSTGVFDPQRKERSATWVRAIRRVPFTGNEPAIGAAYEGGFFGGLIDAKDTPDGTATHALIVAPRNGGVHGVQTGILDLAQAAFPNGLWWIKDRANSNQHQLVDSVRGGNLALTTPSRGTAAYAAPAGNSVAWCWNLVDDRSNGFDITNYSGNNVNGRTINHGLNQAPEFVILGNSGSTHNYRVWHKDLAANHFIPLNTSGGAVNGATNNAGYPTNFTSTGFDVLQSGADGLAAVNGSGINYYTYLWHSVPGYSAFGSYVGNGNPDGPFIYTGFRPALVITKRTNGAGNWYIKDTARNPNNPVTWELNSDNELPDHSDGAIDYLSNGFKPRNTNSSQNDSGGTYIYAAFAEMGFGGANISPAPAR